MQSSTKNEQQVYQKIKVLGQGSMGRAYLVKSSIDQKLYVMKRINVGYLSSKEKQSAQKQAQLHSLVSHPNIIAFKEIYHTTKNKLCIIMEYAEGGDLDQLIEQQGDKNLSQQTIMTYFTQVCLALREIHDKKIVHRDLKGANIFLKEGQIKLGDFGISKVLDKTVLASKSFVGTPYYLSPQMVQGKPYSTKADIWSLGVILYHMCALKLPFEGNSLPILALKIMKGSFPKLMNSIYSKQLKVLITNLLQVDSRKRPSIKQILLKPIVNKYLPKDILEKMVKQKPKLQIKAKKIKNLTEKSQKMIGETQNSGHQKQENKQKKEEMKEKREEIRRNMREDLKKKRRQVEKEKKYASQTRGGSIAKQKNLETEQKGIKQTVKQKPWKNSKGNKQKKQIEVELFLPEDRPKISIPKKSSSKNFKVQIYVSGNKQKLQSKPVTARNQQTNFIQQKSKSQKSNQLQYQNGIADSEQYEQEQEDNSSEDSNVQQSQDNLNSVLHHVRNAQQLVGNLQNPYLNNISLYEQSDNFDTTIVESSSQSKHYQQSQQQQQNMKYITNPSNLQMLRRNLQQRLGLQNFLTAYRIVQEHLLNGLQLNEIQNSNIQQQDQGNQIFDAVQLRKKLNFLTDEEFDNNFKFLYTLKVLEDIQLRKNIQQT